VPYTYEHPHPAVTVDVVVLTFGGNELRVLLVRRAAAPYAGRWALPGGFVEIDESLKRAAWRELREETGVTASFLEQLGAFGHPDRDPRERVITVAYLALVPADRLRVAPGSDARAARLFAVGKLPQLAFDHAKILRRATQRLRERSSEIDFVLQLMPAEFTLTDLQRAYEAISGQLLDKRNFRKRLQGEGLVESAGRLRRGTAHRPAELYRRVAAAPRRAI
jgi:8-oxo-dGTP diphosphatase